MATWEVLEMRFRKKKTDVARVSSHRPGTDPPPMTTAMVQDEQAVEAEAGTEFAAPVFKPGRKGGYPPPPYSP